MRKLGRLLVEVIIIIVVAIMAVAYAERETQSNVWGLYTRESVGIWRPCISEEILKMSDDNKLVLEVINLKANEQIVWSWKYGLDDVWHVQAQGEALIELDEHSKTARGWDVIRIFILTQDGAYHPLGEYTISFGAEGDFELEDCFIHSYGNGTLVVSLPTESDIVIVDASGATKFTMRGVPPVDLELREVDLGDIIKVVGRDGEKRSLPRYYQVTEDDF